MTTVKEVSRQNAIAHQAEKARLKELESQYPQSLLLIRDVEARSVIAGLKGLPVEEQIKGILRLPVWAISNDISSQEINAILGFLDCNKMLIFEHGMQSNSMTSPSSHSKHFWVLRGFDHQHDRPNYFTPPKTGVECVAYLLSL